MTKIRTQMNAGSNKQLALSMSTTQSFIIIDVAMQDMLLTASN